MSPYRYNWRRKLCHRASWLEYELQRCEKYRAGVEPETGVRAELLPMFLAPGSRFRHTICLPGSHKNVINCTLSTQARAHVVSLSILPVQFLFSVGIIMGLTVAKWACCGWWRKLQNSIIEHLYFDREKAEPSERKKKKRKKERACHFVRHVCEGPVFWYGPVWSGKGKWVPVWEKGLKLCYGA